MGSSAWSLIHKKCRECGTDKIPHRAKGLCVNCYNKSAAVRNSAENRIGGVASVLLTKEYLEKEYLANCRSLGDIAKAANCSRVYVHNRLKAFNIPLRTKSAARGLAYQQGKLDYQKVDGEDNIRTVKQTKHIVNEFFFSVWSNEMAYVLGWIFTDGNLDPGRILDPTRKTTLTIPRFTLAQAEKEPLEKVLHLLGSNSTILFRKKRIINNDVTQGAIFYFHINSAKIYNDLISLGLMPNKSNVVKFPNVPYQYLRHFIRGCWDGDGSVYIEKRSGTIHASYVSGSFDFISGLSYALLGKGLSARNIYELKRPGMNKSYSFRFSGDDCYKLYRYLYDGVDERLYLSRKYKLFAEYFNAKDTSVLKEKYQAHLDVMTNNKIGNDSGTEH